MITRITHKGGKALLRCQWDPPAHVEVITLKNHTEALRVANFLGGLEDAQDQISWARKLAKPADTPDS